MLDTLHALCQEVKGPVVPPRESPRKMKAGPYQARRWSKCAGAPRDVTPKVTTLEEIRNLTKIKSWNAEDIMQRGNLIGPTRLRLSRGPWTDSIQVFHAPPTPSSGGGSRLECQAQFRSFQRFSIRSSGPAGTDKEGRQTCKTGFQVQGSPRWKIHFHLITPASVQLVTCPRWLPIVDKSRSGSAHTSTRAPMRPTWKRVRDTSSRRWWEAPCRV